MRGKELIFPRARNFSENATYMAIRTKPRMESVPVGGKGNQSTQTVAFGFSDEARSVPLRKVGPIADFSTQRYK